MNSFDIDGVILLAPDLVGVRPYVDDIIITGRSTQEYLATSQLLYGLDIRNQVFYNPIPWAEKTRESSGMHKAATLKMLYESGLFVGVHFEDDPIQADIIEQYLKARRVPTSVVRVIHDLTERENVWHSPK